MNRHTIMRHHYVPDQNERIKKAIDESIRMAKKNRSSISQQFRTRNISNKGVVLQQTNLKIIDLSFNNIEELPIDIKNFESLEQLFLNNNPLQYLPIEISRCKKLKVLNLAHSFVQYLPREMSSLQNLFLLDMTECPIKGKLQEAYEMGIVYIFKYLQRKTDRAIYRELIVKKLKEWVYMGNSLEEIQEVMQRVMDNLKDVETVSLKRLLRNLTNIFPLKIDDVDPDEIRNKLFFSLVQTNLQSSINVHSTLQDTRHIQIQDENLQKDEENIQEAELIQQQNEENELQNQQVSKQSLDQQQQQDQTKEKIEQEKQQQQSASKQQNQTSKKKK